MSILTLYRTSRKTNAFHADADATPVNIHSIKNIRRQRHLQQTQQRLHKLQHTLVHTRQLTLFLRQNMQLSAYQKKRLIFLARRLQTLLQKKISKQHQQFLTQLADLIYALIQSHAYQSHPMFYNLTGHITSGLYFFPQEHKNIFMTLWQNMQLFYLQQLAATMAMHIQQEQKTVSNAQLNKHATTLLLFSVCAITSLATGFTVLGCLCVIAACQAAAGFLIGTYALHVMRQAKQIMPGIQHTLWHKNLIPNIKPVLAEDIPNPKHQLAHPCIPTMLR